MARTRPHVLVAQSDRPVQQGDLFLSAGVAGLTTAGSNFALGGENQERFTLATQDMVARLDAVAMQCLVMVVSHDCQLDKEVHLAARRLLKDQPGLTADEAYAQAANDPDLDRYVVVSPVVDSAGVSVAGGAIDLGLLRSGRVIGYLPIPEQSPLMPRDAVVDLSIRATVDRHALTARLATLTDEARVQLRYALARMDSLRTPDIGAELAAAVGSRIAAVHAPDGKTATVRIDLENGQQLELLPRPAVP